MGKRPLWTATQEDLKTLDVWFDRLPATCGKAPWHRAAETTLEAICRDAENRIEEGEYEADAQPCPLRGGVVGDVFVTTPVSE